MTDGTRGPQARGADEPMGPKWGMREAPPATTPYEEECELCGSRMYGLHCKLVCPTCGYRRDCSDP